MKTKNRVAITELLIMARDKVESYNDDILRCEDLGRYQLFAKDERQVIEYINELISSLNVKTSYDREEFTYRD